MRADHLTRFTPENPEPLAKSPVCTRLPESLDEEIKALPNRAELIRLWIIEGYERYKQESLKK